MLVFGSEAALVSDMDASKSPLLQTKFTVARLAEEFFWVGGSIVASPRWKIGHVGKMQAEYLLLQ